MDHTSESYRETTRIENILAEYYRKWNIKIYNSECAIYKTPKNYFTSLVDDVKQNRICKLALVAQCLNVGRIRMPSIVQDPNLENIAIMTNLIVLGGICNKSVVHLIKDFDETVKILEQANVTCVNPTFDTLEVGAALYGVTDTVSRQLKGRNGYHTNNDEFTLHRCIVTRVVENIGVWGNDFEDQYTTDERSRVFTWGRQKALDLFYPQNKLHVKSVWTLALCEKIRFSKIFTEENCQTCNLYDETHEYYFERHPKSQLLPHIESVEKCKREKRALDSDDKIYSVYTTRPKSGIRYIHRNVWTDSYEEAYELAKWYNYSAIISIRKDALVRSGKRCLRSNANYGIAYLRLNNAEFYRKVKNQNTFFTKSPGLRYITTDDEKGNYYYPMTTSREQTLKPYKKELVITPIITPSYNPTFVFP